MPKSQRSVKQSHATPISKHQKLTRFLDGIHCGNSAIVLRKIPDNSVDLVITSPPYFQQRSYGWGETGMEKRVDDYIDAVNEVFVQCVRVVKQQGSIVFNMGDKYVKGNLMLVPYRFAISATNEGKVKLVNNITWVKSNPTPRQFQRRLVSSTEPFFHFVKSNSYFYNIDDFQNNNTNLPKPIKNTTIGSKYKGLITNSDLTNKQKTMAFKELRKTIAEVKSGKIASFRMKIQGIHSPAFGGQSGGRLSQMTNNGFTIIKMTGKSLKRDVITHKVESLKWNNHPAIYPEGIISEMIRLLTPKKAVVLDPYMGSGTTGVAAKSLGKHYIGIDLNPEYCEAAKKRIRDV